MKIQKTESGTIYFMSGNITSMSYVDLAPAHTVTVNEVGGVSTTFDCADSNQLWALMDKLHRTSWSERTQITNEDHV